VRFDNPRAKVKLADTLTRPKGPGPFTAVLLVAGSGPLTRDEIVFDHRVFLPLSDYLTRRGLAVLRYDKRGVAWPRFFLTHSPVPALEKVRCPVLALSGGKDLLVPSKDNLRGIARALAVSGNTDFVIREMPGLNHLFQHCQTGAESEYAKSEETMSPEVLQIVGDWILQHVKPSP